MFKTESSTYLSTNLILINTELLRFDDFFLNNHYAVNSRICFTNNYCICVLKKIQLFWRKWFHLKIQKLILFLFKDDQDDFDVEEQRKCIENMLKDATTLKFQKFLMKLKEAMTPNVFDNIKCQLLGKYYDWLEYCLLNPIWFYI